MLLRGIGALLVSFSGGTYGFKLKNNYQKRILYVEQFLLHLEELKGNVAYNNEEIQEILDNLSCDLYYGMFFQNIMKKMKEGQALKDAWTISVEEVLEHTVLTNKELKIIKELGLQLGEHHRETQIRQIEFFQNKLTLLHLELKKEEKEKCKLYTSLGILGGVMVSIILV